MRGKWRRHTSTVASARGSRTASTSTSRLFFSYEVRVTLFSNKAECISLCSFPRRASCTSRYYLRVRGPATGLRASISDIILAANERFEAEAPAHAQFSASATTLYCTVPPTLLLPTYVVLLLVLCLRSNTSNRHNLTACPSRVKHGDPRRRVITPSPFSPPRPHGDERDAAIKKIGHGLRSGVRVPAGWGVAEKRTRRAPHEDWRTWFDRLRGDVGISTESHLHILCTVLGSEPVPCWVLSRSDH